MKRLTILVILLILTASSVGCRRGARMWGLRGARCAPPPGPPPCVESCDPCYGATTAAPQDVYLSPPPAAYDSGAAIYSEVSPAPATSAPLPAAPPAGG